MPGNWGDLRTRVVSALGLLVLGGTTLWLGGAAFHALVVLACSAMIWELVRMTAPAVASWRALLAGGLAAAVLAVVPLRGGLDLVPLLLLAPVAAVFVFAGQLRLAAGLYAVLILLAGLALVSLRMTGLAPVLWLVAVVVASDVLGYFAGRAFGGPKFWPAISPKKTWSGTVAGWVGAALVGLVAMLSGPGGDWWLVAVSPLLAFAGQLGDILESWFKRRCGVKDSSNLIPGHGGVLDRFDALLTASVTLMLLMGITVALALGGAK